MTPFPISLSQFHYLPASSSSSGYFFSSNHLLDSRTDTDSSCGSTTFVVVVWRWSLPWRPLCWSQGRWSLGWRLPGWRWRLVPRPGLPWRSPMSDLKCNVWSPTPGPRAAAAVAAAILCARDSSCVNCYVLSLCELLCESRLLFIPLLLLLATTCLRLSWREKPFLSVRTLTSAVGWEGIVGRMGGWATGTLGLAAFLALGAAASAAAASVIGLVGRLGDLGLFHNSFLPGLDLDFELIYNTTIV